MNLWAAIVARVTLAGRAVRQAFASRGDYGGGSGGWAGAKTGNLTGDWTSFQRDPKDLWTFESQRLIGRTEDLIRNNPYAASMVETMTSGPIGPRGLVFKSTYQLDESAEVSEAEQRVRDIINEEVADAFAGSSFDAGGQMSKRDMSLVVLAHCVADGDGFAVRCNRPDRPGVHSHATCWRIIHPSRVSNIGYAGNSKDQFEGLKLDADGVPVAITVLRQHPSSVQAFTTQWDTIPIFNPLGLRDVVHLKASRFADCPRGFGWLSPIMTLLQHLGKTEEAYVIAKRVQSCNIYVVEADDPVAAAATDAKGALLGPNTKIQPGRVYYVKKGCAVNYLNGQFNGADFEAFTDVLLTAMCSTLNIPKDFVLNQLTKANLASARAALMQAWATFTAVQELLIVHVEQPWVESVIYESWLRGRIPVTRENLRRAFKGTYARPAQAFPDPAREIQAAEGKARLGVSPQTIFEQLGLDFDDEMTRRERNLRRMEKKGLLIQDFLPVPPPEAPAKGAGKPPADQAPVDPDAGTAYDPAASDDAKAEPQEANA